MKKIRKLILCFSIGTYSTIMANYDLESHIESHVARFKSADTSEINKSGISGNAGFGMSYHHSYGIFYGRFGFWGINSSGMNQNSDKSAWMTSGYIDLGYDWTFTNNIVVGIYIRQLYGPAVNLHYQDLYTNKYILQASPKVGYRFHNIFKSFDLLTYVQYQHAINLSDTHQLFGGGLSLSLPFSVFSQKTESVIEHSLESTPIKPEPQTVESPAPKYPTLTIRFDYDRFILDEKTASRMKKLANRMNQNPEKWQNLDIHGHTDTKGHPDYNKSLSEKRAIFIKEQFTQIGVERKRIRIFAHGSEMTLQNIPTDSPEQRRVEIQVFGTVEPQFIAELNAIINAN